MRLFDLIEALDMAVCILVLNDHDIDTLPSLAAPPGLWTKPYNYLACDGEKTKRHGMAPCAVMKGICARFVVDTMVPFVLC